MNERRFNGLITKLRNPERLERLQIDRVMAYSLAGIEVINAVDVGTSTGVFAEALLQRGVNVRAVDCNPEFLQVARELVPDAEFIEAPAEQLPFADKSCDLVFMGHVLHETDDAEKSLREAFRVTAKRLAILEWPCVEQPVGPPLDHRMPLEKIKELGFAAGFSICDVIQLKMMQLIIFDR